MLVTKAGESPLYESNTNLSVWIFLDVFTSDDGKITLRAGHCYLILMYRVLSTFICNTMQT